MTEYQFCKHQRTDLSSLSWQRHLNGISKMHVNYCLINSLRQHEWIHCGKSVTAANESSLEVHTWQEKAVLAVCTTLPTGRVSTGERVSTNRGVGQSSGLTFTVRSLQVLFPLSSTTQIGTCHIMTISDYILDTLVAVLIADTLTTITSITNLVAILYIKFNTFYYFRHKNCHNNTRSIVFKIRYSRQLSWRVASKQSKQRIHLTPKTRQFSMWLSNIPHPTLYLWEILQQAARIE